MEPHVQLEQEIGKWMGFLPENVVACSSGTAALHLALEAFQLPAGSECITPDFTMIACPRAITLAGLTPVFVDCDDKLLMDLRSMDQAFTHRTEVVMPVHIYGRRCDMDYIANWAKKLPAAGDTLIVEDLAEAHGIKPHRLTDAACWSFYRNKIIAGEEGGAVAFKDPGHAALARQLRSLGFTEAHDFNHVPRGHNYRLAPSLAQKILRPLRALGQPLSSPNPALVGLDILGQRRVIERWYEKHCPNEWRMPTRDVVWVYDMRIPGLNATKQMEIIRTLNREGIPARRAFQPMSRQKEYHGCRLVSAKRTDWDIASGLGESVADVMAREVLYLPVQPGITTEEQVEKPFEIIKSMI